MAEIPDRDILILAIESSCKSNGVYPADEDSSESAGYT